MAQAAARVPAPVREDAQTSIPGPVPGAAAGEAGRARRFGGAEAEGEAGDVVVVFARRGGPGDLGPGPELAAAGVEFFPGAAGVWRGTFGR